MANQDAMTPSDVRITAQEVVEALCKVADDAFAAGDDNEAWTDRVLGALAALAREGCCVDPDPAVPHRGRGRRKNEWLWDLTISTWPRYGDQPYEFPAYFDTAARRKRRLLLVAESEWGVSRSWKENGHAVMHDFCKLIDARAPLKVMVFGYIPGESASTFEGLEKRMRDLIDATGDNADYVLFGVSWRENDYEWVRIERETVFHGRRSSGQ